VTGEKSDAAIVITTLIVASAFTPAKDRLGKFLSARFRDVPDGTRTLRSFSHEVSAYLDMSDAALLARRFLNEAASALRAESGAVSLVIDGRLQTACTTGHWQGEAWIALPLEWGGQRSGLLWLGPRLGGEPYGRGEFEALQQAAQPVARALRLALHVHPAPEATVATQLVETREAPSPAEKSSDMTRLNETPAVV
jgi:hypothetical protein